MRPSDTHGRPCISLLTLVSPRRCNHVRYFLSARTHPGTAVLFPVLLFRQLHPTNGSNQTSPGSPIIFSFFRRWPVSRIGNCTLQRRGQHEPAPHTPYPTCVVPLARRPSVSRLLTRAVSLLPGCVALPEMLLLDLRSSHISTLKKHTINSDHFCGRAHLAPPASTRCMITAPPHLRLLLPLMRLPTFDFLASMPPISSTAFQYLRTVVPSAAASVEYRIVCPPSIFHRFGCFTRPFNTATVVLPCHILRYPPCSIAALLLAYVITCGVPSTKMRCRIYWLLRCGVFRTFFGTGFLVCKCSCSVAAAMLHVDCPTNEATLSRRAFLRLMGEYRKYLGRAWALRVTRFLRACVLPHS